MTRRNFPAPKSETPTADQASGVSGKTQKHTDPEILPEADAERKRFDTLAAHAAIKSHTLQKLGSGYLLSKWGHVRHFVDLDTAEAMLRRIEGGKS